jgi:hypothetical protein
VKRSLALIIAIALFLAFSSQSFAKTRMSPEARAAQKRARQQQKAMKKYAKTKNKEHKAASHH